MSLLINNVEFKSFHFTGILGAGMSAIAFYLKNRGAIVGGSDRMLNNDSTAKVQKYLIKTGCLIFDQTGEGVTQRVDAVVISTAIEDSNPDIAKAKELNLPIFHRSDILAAIVKTKKTVAVAGTSGKSTVTAMIFHTLNEYGLNPSLITGAPLNALSEQGVFGSAIYTESDLLIIEADESDGTVVKYEPYISLFLNLSKDHKPISETIELFKTLVSKSEKIIKNGDDKELSSLNSDTTFGLSASNNFAPNSFGIEKNSSYLTIDDTEYSLPYPGEHMVMNLLATISVASTLGLSHENISKAIRNYKGIGRRFDIYTASSGRIVIDDYAHNPEKIKAALKTAQQMSESIIAIFQPHGFGPTRFLFNELVEVFSETLRKHDALILAPIYYVGGTVAKDISSTDLANKILDKFKNVIAPNKRSDIPKLIADNYDKESLIISMGARDPSLPLFAKDIITKQ